MSLDPKQERSALGVEIPEAAESGLRGALFREAVRRTVRSAGFVGVQESSLRCFVTGVSESGELTIRLVASHAAESGEISKAHHTFTVGLQDRLVGKETLRPEHRAALANVLIEAVERFAAPEGENRELDLSVRADDSGELLAIDHETFSIITALPGKTNVLARITDEDVPAVVDVRVWNALGGFVRIAGWRELDDGSLAPARSQDEMNIYRIEIGEGLKGVAVACSMLAHPRVIDRVFNSLISECKRFGFCIQLEQLERLVHRELFAPDSFGGEPVALSPEIGGKQFSEVGEALTVNSERMEDVRASWNVDGTVRYYGFYLADEEGCYQFLDAYRHTSGDDTILVVGARDNGASSENPPTRPDEVKRYLCFVNGELMQRTLVPLGHENREAVEAKFLILVRCYTQFGIDKVREFLGGAVDR
jgi:hypothetical protein